VRANPLHSACVTRLVSFPKTCPNPHQTPLVCRRVSDAVSTFRCKLPGSMGIMAAGGASPGCPGVCGAWILGCDQARAGVSRQVLKPAHWDHSQIPGSRPRPTANGRFLHQPSSASSGRPMLTGWRKKKRHSKHRVDADRTPCQQLGGHSPVLDAASNNAGPGFFRAELPWREKRHGRGIWTF